MAFFDTAFHRGHPWVNDTFALPRRFYDDGIRRYGFHGLRHVYITSVIERDGSDLHASGMIIAHLGNGAAMCAVRNGKSIGSTMGFSALDGLPMGTRCGRIDPGAVLHLIEEKGMTPKEVLSLLCKKAGCWGYPVSQGTCAHCWARISPKRSRRSTITCSARAAAVLVEPSKSCPSGGMFRSEFCSM